MQRICSKCNEYRDVPEVDAPCPTCGKRTYPARYCETCDQLRESDAATCGVCSETLLTVSAEYSWRDLSQQSLSRRKAAAFSDVVVYGSSFAQEVIKPRGEARRKRFPKGAKGLLFAGCNLTNCELPAQARAGKRCAHKRVLPKRDKATGEVHDWEVDASGDPVRPVDTKGHEREGLSLQPTDAEDVNPDGS